MSKTPNYDAKVGEILHALKPGEQVCELTGEKWQMTEEEISWYKKFNVPPSRRSPQTRMDIVTSFYVGYQWWNQKHPETGKTLITSVHPATGLKVLPDKEWHEKDFSSENLDYDATKSVFDQMRELQLRIPLPAYRNVKEPENSIALASYGDRNSYFTLLTHGETSLYSVWVEGMEHSCLINSSLNVNDSFYVHNSADVFGSKFVSTSKEVMNSDFVFFSTGIESCFGVSNRSRAKYLWFDEQLSQGEWEKRRGMVDLRCRDEFEKTLAKWQAYLGSEVIWQENMSVNAENCIGEYIYNCRDLQYVYDASHSSHNAFWSAHLFKSSFAAYTGVMSESEDSYMSTNVNHSRGTFFSYAPYYCQNVEYCFQCFNCENCFGCFGLNRKKFHIFNKEYSEEEYWKRVDELKCAMLDRGEYGEFFPLAMSPAYFGQSGAAINYGTSTDKVKQLDGLDFDPESAGAIGEDLATAELTNSKDVPNCIDDLDDSWVNKPLLDEEHGRRYVMIKPEIEFYREKKLAPPTDHFVHRVIDMMHESNLGVYDERECEKCQKKVTVAKNLKYPNRRIYCKECYLAYRETR